MFRSCVWTVCLISIIGYALAETKTCGTDHKITFTETVMDSGIRQLQWIGGDMMVVFALTEGDKLWRSQDGGVSWLEQTTYLEGLPSSGVKDLYADAEHERIYVVTHENYIYVSKSRGAGYKKLTFEGEAAVSVKTHPKDGRRVAFSAISPGCVVGNVEDPCLHSLYISNDDCATILKIKDFSIRQYDWGSADHLWFTGVKLVNGTEPGRFSPYTTLYYVSAIRPAEAPIEKLRQVVAFLMSAHVMYVAGIASVQDGGLKLSMSLERGERPVKAINFPGDVTEERYTIVETTEDEVFVNVQQGDYNWGNLYVSRNIDSEKPEFVLSLARHVRTPTGTVEFAKFHGLDGVFIANVREDTGHVIDVFEERMTVFSYDKGGHWDKLHRPAKDVQGNPIQCEQCSTQLHGVRKQRLHRDYYQRMPYSPLHTKANTVGLILGSGNVGEYVTDQPEEVRVLFSRDAGSTWEEIADGIMVYDFADHGAFIAMAAKSAESTKVRVSGDEALTWQECTFSDAAVYVEDLVADPDSVGEMMLLHGERDGKGVLVHIDLRDYFTRVCADADYEQWTPSYNLGSKCILGREMAFRRRKRDADCYNEVVLDHKSYVNATECACTRNDYECDFCYVPSRVRGFALDEQRVECTRDPLCHSDSLEGGTADSDSMAPADCKEGATYTVTRGYRLIDGNQCSVEKGLDLKPSVYKCPASGDGKMGSNPGMIVLLLLLAVVVVAALAFVCFWLRRRRAMPSDLTYGTLEGGGGGGGDDDDSFDDDSFEEQAEARVLKDEDISKIDESDGDGGGSSDEEQRKASKPKSAKKRARDAAPESLASPSLVEATHLIDLGADADADKNGDETPNGVADEKDEFDPRA